MKLFLSIVSLLVMASAACAQHGWRNLEFEVGTSVVHAARSYGARIDYAGALLAEVRYNFSGTPFDAGLRFSYGSFTRAWAPPEGIDQICRLRNFLLVGDYNFLRGKNVSPYFGAGFGVSTLVESIYYPSHGVSERRWSPCLTPRIGIEFWRVGRLSAGYKAMNKPYSNFEYSLSVVFGGWGR